MRFADGYPLLIGGGRFWHEKCTLAAPGGRSYIPIGYIFGRFIQINIVNIVREFQLSTSIRPDLAVG